MLDFLHIENIAVIKKLDIDFGKGFNVLTGETGAGKSIIIDSVSMLLGGKISKELIRHGENRAIVSAVFSNVEKEIYTLCDELGIPYDSDDDFSLYRCITTEGKSIVKINSSPATVAQLRAIGTKLINIHGQNDNQSFLNKESHIRLLDEFANAEQLLSEYSKIYQSLTSLKSEINSLLEANKQKDTMIDILKYQIKEINAAKLKDLKEEEKLIEVSNRLKAAEKITKYANNVYKALLQNESGISASILLDKAIDSLSKLTDVMPDANEMLEQLNNFKYEIEDIADRAKSYGSFDGISDPKKELEQIEDRLALIQKLEKKYGQTIEDILKFKESADEKLSLYESYENRIEDLKFEYKKLYLEACKIANDIHNLRESASKNLSKQIKDALKFLDMPKVNFQIAVNTLENENKQILNSLGYDDVEFMIATNAGEELSPMCKIASGGELSRIMLALKSALSDKKGAQTIIFDEIDTGVSGSTSQKIGIKLAQISKCTQTFCVTHSAQIASLAERHYFIKKAEIEGRAETSVSLLNDEEKVEEIARIIGGIDLTDKQYDAAKELISQSREILRNL